MEVGNRDYGFYGTMTTTTTFRLGLWRYVAATAANERASSSKQQQEPLDFGSGGKSTMSVRPISG